MRWRSTDWQGDFFETYHNESFFRARLRASSVEDRVAALRDVAEPTQVDLWENENLHRILMGALSDESPQVREQAAWSLGAIGAGGSAPGLLELLAQPSQPDAVRAQAAIALARLGAEPAHRQAIEGALGGATQELKIELLHALGLMAQRESFEAILPWVGPQVPDELALHALWALHRTQHPGARQVLRAQLAVPDASARRRCGLLDAMKMVSSAEDVNWARKRFLSTPTDQACERLVWEERDERRRTIVFSDTLRTKYMKIVANSGQAADYLSWFQSIASDPSEPFVLRENAGKILKQFR